MILIKTHANRWIARERRRSPVVGRITRFPCEKHPVCFRTEAWDPGSDERTLLRDCDTLEVAFALLLAHIIRVRERCDRRDAIERPLVVGGRGERDTSGLLAHTSP